MAYQQITLLNAGQTYELWPMLGDNRNVSNSYSYSVSFESYDGWNMPSQNNRFNFDVGYKLFLDEAPFRTMESGNGTGVTFIGSPATVAQLQRLRVQFPEGCSGNFFMHWNRYDMLQSNPLNQSGDLEHVFVVRPKAIETVTVREPEIQRIVESSTANTPTPENTKNAFLAGSIGFGLGFLAGRATARINRK